MINTLFKILSESQLFEAVEGKIYPVIIPQGISFPAVTYQVVSNNPNETKSLGSTVDQARIEIKVFADKLDEVNNLANKLREDIDFLPPNEAVFPGYDGLKYISETDDFDEEQELFYRRIEYYYRYKRSL